MKIMLKLGALGVFLLSAVPASAQITDRISGVTSGLAVKAPVAAVTNANITLSGEQTINGVAVTTGDRVLVKDQTTASQNGIYVVDTSLWERASDFDGNRDVVQGTLVVVYNSQVEGVLYQVTTADPITIDSSSIVFNLWDDPAISYPITAAEVAAAVTPTNYAYPAGHLYRYGAVSDGSTNNATAFANAVAQCNTNNSAARPVFIPRTTLGFNIGTGVTITFPCTIYGEDRYYSYLVATSDITPIKISNNQEGFLLDNFQVFRSGATTLPGIEIENSANGTLRRVHSTGFHTGVLFDNGASAPQSSFLNAIEDSIISGTTYGIDAESSTNALTMRNVTFGGGTTGFRIFESTGLAIYGGDSESCVVTCIDLDTTAPITMGAIISGVNFEASNATGGTIRIGNTAKVTGVTIVGNGFYNSGAAEYLINTVRAGNISIIGNASSSVNSGRWVNMAGTDVDDIVIMNGQAPSSQALQILNGTLSFNDTAAGLAGYGGRIAQNKVSVTYSASMTPDAALGNQFDIVVTNNSAFTINNPTNPIDGQEIVITIFNTSGGAHGAGTFGAAFKLAGGGSSVPAIATSNNRSFTFRYRTNAWIETARNAADVPN